MESEALKVFAPEVAIPLGIARTERHFVGDVVIAIAIVLIIIAIVILSKEKTADAKKAGWGILIAGGVLGGLGILLARRKKRRGLFRL